MGLLSSNQGAKGSGAPGGEPLYEGEVIISCYEMTKRETQLSKETLKKQKMSSERLQTVTEKDFVNTKRYKQLQSSRLNMKR